MSFTTLANAKNSLPAPVETFSGRDLDRPALQRLLTDIHARKVDCVVCYQKGAEIKCLCQRHLMLWYFRFSSVFIKWTPHHKRPRRYQHKLHRNRIRRLHRHTQKLGPVFLMFLGFLGVEKSYSGRRRIGTVWVFTRLFTSIPRHIT